MLHLMDKFGYLLSEAPVCFLIFWFAFRLVQYRRYRNNRPIVSKGDHELLSRTAKPEFSLKFLHKLLVAITIVALSGYLEIVLLAPVGAAILTATLLLTSAAVVNRLLLAEN